MKQKTLNRIDNILELIEKGNMYVIAGIATVIAIPFLMLNEAWKFLVKILKGKVYDSASKEWITKKERENNILKEKQKNREIPLTDENHVTPNKNDRFFFFEKRKLSIPYDKLVYVETEYNEKLHNFFSDNAEWLETWQKWHGWDIINVDYDDLKEECFILRIFMFSGMDSFGILILVHSIRNLIFWGVFIITMILTLILIFPSKSKWSNL